MNRKTILTLAATALIGIVVGFGAAQSGQQQVVDDAVDAAIAAVTPAPTPVPKPDPTPQQVITITAPPECIAAIDMMTEQDLPDLQFIIDVLDAYLDHPNEGLAAFGQRVSDLMLALEPISEADIDERSRLVNACRAAL